MKIKVRGGAELLEDGFRLIQDITLTEDVLKLEITTDANNNTLNLKEVGIYMHTPVGNNEGVSGDIFINDVYKLNPYGGIKISKGNYERYGFLYGKVFCNQLLTISQFPDSEKIQRPLISNQSAYIANMNYECNIKNINKLSICMKEEGKVIEKDINFKIYGK